MRKLKLMNFLFLIIIVVWEWKMVAVQYSTKQIARQWWRSAILFEERTCTLFRQARRTWTTISWNCWSWRTPAKRRRQRISSEWFLTCRTQNSARCANEVALSQNCWRRWCARADSHISSPWTFTKKKSKDFSTVQLTTFGLVRFCYSIFKNL